MHFISTQSDHKLRPSLPARPEQYPGSEGSTPVSQLMEFGTSVLRKQPHSCTSAWRPQRPPSVWQSLLWRQWCQHSGLSSPSGAWTWRRAVPPLEPSNSFSTSVKFNTLRLLTGHQEEGHHGNEESKEAAGQGRGQTVDLKWTDKEESYDPKRKRIWRVAVVWRCSECGASPAPSPHKQTKQSKAKQPFTTLPANFQGTTKEHRKEQKTTEQRLLCKVLQ